MNEKSAMIKDALILFAITVVAGLLLGVVYDVTKEPIAQQKEKAKQAACAEVFAEAKAFETITQMDGSAVSDTIDGVDIDEVMRAVDGDGNTAGYVITVTDHEGYGGDIQFSMGVALDGTLNGISILSISETAGLGMKAGDVLVPQFADKRVKSFTYTKSGASNDSEIDAISGATITTNAVVNGVNAGLVFFEKLLSSSNMIGGISNEK